MRLLPAIAIWSGVIFAGTLMLPAASAAPVRLAVDNAAASVWDTDRSKVGIELQIVNHGDAAAEDVRISSVAVRGGTFIGPRPLPVTLGTIASRASTMLDLVIAMAHADRGEYLLTVFGTYRHSGVRQGFLLTQAVASGAGAPAPMIGQSGLTTLGPAQHAGSAEPPRSGGLTPSAPNAATPMLIPPGPPRGSSPPATSPTTSQR